ncbi:MAG: hypothetical protein DWG80_01315 [Chloroflexi bacterium]|nr:hypothetical protein [Chloroflexota bacterium]
MRGRCLADWVLVAIAVEKAVQHVFITWGFAADRFELREQVAPPWEVLLVAGGVVAVLFVVALVGLLRWQSWAPQLLVGLAVFDIVGEFVGQGTIMIEIVVSFLVAVALLILAVRALPQYRRGVASA